jgi:iron complex outermembrane receptor protein
MMKQHTMKPRAIAVAVLTLMSTTVLAQTDKEQSLGTITAVGVRAEGMRPETVEAGSFRGADIMEVPSVVNVITRETLELQAAESLYDVVRNTAGVTRQQNAGETFDQLVIRGIGVENRTNYRLNGSMPIINFGRVSLENKERVEVLKGASALYYGFTSPAGVVNFTTKRAGAKPVTSVGLSLDQYGSAVVSADLARRFGSEDQVGVRINAAGGSQGSYMDGAKNGDRGFVSAALDWKVNSRLSLRADLEHDRRNVIEQAGVAIPSAVNGVITLPHAVDPKKMVGSENSTFKTTTTNVLLRADYLINDNWSMNVEAGRADTERERNLSIFRFANAAAVATGAGYIQGSAQVTNVTSDMLKAELFGIVNTGAIQHELTIGTSYTEKDQGAIKRQTFRSPANSQNLYNPIPIAGLITYTDNAPVAPYSTKDTGIYVLDRMRLNEQWQVIGGLRYSNYKSTQDTVQYDVNKTTPTAAIIYRPTQALSFYASYIQGLEEGEAGPSGTTNEGVRLSPGVSKQKEIGVRWLAGNGTLLSAALFDIERPGYYTNASKYYVADGQQRYTGLELSAQGNLTSTVDWQASAQWLDPRFKDINDTYNGKLPENASRQTASLFLNWKPSFVPGWSLNAGAYYTGRRPVDDLNQAWLGGTTLFSAGTRYTFRQSGYQHTVQLNIDNAANKQYWAGGGNRLAAGSPRTLKLTYKLDM